MKTNRSFLKNSLVALATLYTGTKLAACSPDLPPPNNYPNIEAVDASTQPTKEDPQPTIYSDAGISSTDAGSCVYDNSNLVTNVFDVNYFDANNTKSENNINSQRLTQAGGLTVKELRDNASQSGTVYSLEAFKALYDNNKNIRDAMYSDFLPKIQNVTCSLDMTQNQSDFEIMMNQYFGGGFDTQKIQHRDTNSIYFTKATGNDGIEMTIMLSLVELMNDSNGQPGIPMILTATPVDKTYQILYDLAQGGF